MLGKSQQSASRGKTNFMELKGHTDEVLFAAFSPFSVSLPNTSNIEYKILQSNTDEFAVGTKVR